MESKNKSIENKTAVIDWSTKHVGCEMHSVLVGDYLRFKPEAQCDHFQFTPPTVIPLSKLREIGESYRLISHDNLFNALGENDWNEIEPFAEQVRALKPVHSVVHFTNFRPRKGIKSGVHFDLEYCKPAYKQRIVDQVLRWQDKVGVPVSLENIPLSKNVRAYFDLLLEVKQRVGCLMTCDVPHFIIAAFSSEGDRGREFVSAYAQELNPIQVHLGSISIFNGVIRDNHKKFQPWLAPVALGLFPNVSYVTVEQYFRTPPETAIHYLNELRTALPKDLSEVMGEAVGNNIETANDELAKDASGYHKEFTTAIRVLDSPKDISRNLDGFSSALDIYKKYVPFYFPLATIDSFMNDSDPVSAVKAAAGLARWSLHYLEWWFPHLPKKALVRYGEGGIDSRSVQFEKVVSDFGLSDKREGDMQNATSVIRFDSPKGFWVDVAFPEFSNSNSNV